MRQAQLQKAFCSGSVNPLKDFEKTIYEAKVIKDGDYLRFIFLLVMAF
ncbi:MAG: hypothetical protein L6U99_06290 [Clostridium sp.]|nr:MAG: hypothetical protein L6U99_06290 [Clostridium sp.]